MRFGYTWPPATSPPSSSAGPRPLTTSSRASLDFVNEPRSQETSTLWAPATQGSWRQPYPFHLMSHQLGQERDVRTIGIESYLTEMGLPSRDNYALPTSTKRFEDGSHFRIEELPSTLEQYEKMFSICDDHGFVVNRISDTRGVMS